MFNGYMGKILNVDLSTNKLKDEEFDEKFARKFIGGYGIGVRTIFSRQRPGVDPLGPENILGILSGPLNGTRALSGTRFTVVGKSPATGCWSDSNSGGYFSAYLKFAGYDSLFFTGISEKPVYLFIDNGKAELRDASHLWGRDTYETEDILKSELGSDVAVACIGPSGEKLSNIAAVMHAKGHAAGRSGLGAVMGAKKLKAVAVKGRAKVPVADETKLAELRKKYPGKLGGPFHSDLTHRYGTSFVVVELAESGDSPVKNWGSVPEVDYPDASPVGAEATDKYRWKNAACYLCPVGCEALMKEGTGEYKYPAGCHRPEYETIAMFGSNLQNTNIESIIKANDICNRYGIDTISAGSIIGFAIECYENGLITKKDTDGIEMNWGNHQSIVAMTERMAKREGFGSILADGVKVAAQKIGRGGEKYAIHIQGQEVPAHNPIAGCYLATTYIMDASPGRHTQGNEEMQLPGLLPPFDKKSCSGHGLPHKIGSNFKHSLTSAGMCLFVYYAMPYHHILAESMQAVTGWDITTDELIETGERIGNIRQAFTLREGINQLEFAVPGRIIGKPPHKIGVLSGITVDTDTLIREYLTLMDWDLKTARPSKNKLLKLGLEDIARTLYPEA
jgi:aldehyde:ferredoxin oxidoreductase